MAQEKSYDSLPNFTAGRYVLAYLLTSLVRTYKSTFKYDVVLKSTLIDAPGTSLVTQRVA